LPFWRRLQGNLFPPWIDQIPSPIWVAEARHPNCFRVRRQCAGRASCPTGCATASDEEYAAAEKELVDFGERDVRGRIVRRWLFSIVFPILRFFPVTTHRTSLLQREYAHLLRDALLRDIEPGQGERPILHLLATSFTTGHLCSFSSEGFWSQNDNGQKLHRTGMIPLALAVASSSAFPPLFPPTAITRKMLEASNDELPYNPEFLTDGGIYDNLGFAIFSRVLGSSACDINCLILSDACSGLHCLPFALAQCTGCGGGCLDGTVPMRAADRESGLRPS
jgi:hypothetical protein